MTLATSTWSEAVPRNVTVAPALVRVPEAGELIATFGGVEFGNAAASRPGKPGRARAANSATRQRRPMTAAIMWNRRLPTGVAANQRAEVLFMQIQQGRSSAQGFLDTRGCIQKIAVAFTLGRRPETCNRFLRLSLERRRSPDEGPPRFQSNRRAVCTAAASAATRVPMGKSEGASKV